MNYTEWVRRGGRVFLAAAMMAGLAACGGGGGGGGPALPIADNPLPAEFSTTGPGAGGIGDYLTSGGSWRVDLDGQVQTTILETVALLPALVYDSVTDEWTANANGINLPFVYHAANIYRTPPSTCSAPSQGCGELEFYDFDANPATSQYGTFGKFEHDIGNGFAYVHFGLKTPVDDTPTVGVGNFIGEFEGRYYSVGFLQDTLTGAATVTIDFATGAVGFTSSGNGEATAGAATYSLAGNGTFSGNTYQGQLISGHYMADGITPDLIVDPSTSSLSGAIYGPIGLSEAVGVVYGANTAGHDELVGGFWAPVNSISP